MNNDNSNLIQKLWKAASTLRANSELGYSQYSKPVLGLIFLKYAEYKFFHIENFLKKKFSQKKRKISKDDFLSKKGIYLDEKAKYSYLLQLSENQNIGQKIDDAMKIIENDNTDLKDILPKSYSAIDNSLLTELLRLFDRISFKSEIDLFGRIYEYFLGKFALEEGRGAGEFYTPESIVKLIVEIIEPYKGRIYDPACGTGGMFVQSANFITRHKKGALGQLSIFGQEKELSTVRLNKINLAVHGLAGDIRQGISYYDDEHNSINMFDYVMANPPFNVEGVKKEKIKNDKRYIFGVPKVDNANYLWIQIFLSALNKNGRAGFVMANAANDASHSELQIRKKIINQKVVDVIVSITNNFFYNVTLPCSLWFFDKKKITTKRKKKILFINAREIFTDVDRAHKEFSAKQIELISNIVRVYRNENIETKYISKKEFSAILLNNKNLDIPGLCKIVDLDEIEKQDWSLNPGRYIKPKVKKNNKENIYQELKKLDEELTKLNKEASDLEKINKENYYKLLKITNEKK